MTKYFFGFRLTKCFHVFHDFVELEVCGFQDAERNSLSGWQVTQAKHYFAEFLKNYSKIMNIIIFMNFGKNCQNLI